MWDSILRSALSFLLLLIIARWMVRRRLGKFGVYELLAVNAMGDLTSHLAFETQHPILGGLSSVLVWAGALFCVEWMIAKLPWVNRLLSRPPSVLALAGTPDLTALAQARMTLGELEAELRKQGVASLDEVRSVTLEPEGSLSVVKAASVKQELKRLAQAVSQLADRLPS